jgi:hypothetical protein
MLGSFRDYCLAESDWQEVCKCVRPSATSVCGLTMLVYEALRY